jgi:hypothetical protein
MFKQKLFKKSKNKETNPIHTQHSLFWLGVSISKFTISLVKPGNMNLKLIIESHINLPKFSLDPRVLTPQALNKRAFKEQMRRKV